MKDSVNTAEGNNKIFGIGLNKTGTTTLERCGEILGYRCAPYKTSMAKHVMLRNDFEVIKKMYDQYDLFQDWPWPLIYKKIDEMFPGSKFILTVRKDEEKWFNSLKKHSLRTHPTKNFRKLAYGYRYPHKHKQEHLEFYRKHIEDVQSYFAGRKDSFLKICWECGDGWPELCDFLGKDIPDVPFPHENQASKIYKTKTRYVINKLLSYTGI